MGLVQEEEEDSGKGITNVDIKEERGTKRKGENRKARKRKRAPAAEVKNELGEMHLEDV